MKFSYAVSALLASSAAAFAPSAFLAKTASSGVAQQMS